jgi:TPR repeat protein
LQHQAAFDLYENVCFRPLADKSPNGKEVDKSKAYGPGCFNMAKMLMTGKGGVKADRKKAYEVFDRACRAGHGGACHIQAKMLLSPPGALGKGIPYDPYKVSRDIIFKFCRFQLNMTDFIFYCRRWICTSKSVTQATQYHVLHLQQCSYVVIE